MANEIQALASARWLSLKQRLTAAVFDLGDYLVLALSAVGIHLVGIGMVAIGLDQTFVAPLHWMETATHLYLFGSFFWRLIVRATRGEGRHG